MLRAWQRGEAHAHITAPDPHPLVMKALGNSVATAKEGLHAEIAYYTDLDAGAEPAALRADAGGAGSSQALRRDGQPALA